MKFLSRQEEFVLAIILRLDTDAYGIAILKELTKLTLKKWSIGALYDILDRLERKVLVSISYSEPVAKRGGKRKKYYNITSTGYAALQEVKQMQQRIWADLRV